MTLYARIQNPQFFTLRNSAQAPYLQPPASLKAAKTKPKTCTADELHYVPVSSSDWKLALWRYLPSARVWICFFKGSDVLLFWLFVEFLRLLNHSGDCFWQAQRRNHPLLLLSGVGTNAIGYDLAPEVILCLETLIIWIIMLSLLRKLIDQGCCGSVLVRTLHVSPRIWYLDSGTSRSWIEFIGRGRLWRG